MAGMLSLPATAAAAVGILGSAWNSGGMAMLSLLGIPGLLSASIPPQALAKQWEGIYNRGKVLGPQVALVSLLGYAYLAYDRRSRGQSWVGFIAAAGFSVAIGPFTTIVMNATNMKLLDLASGATKAASEASVKELLVKWQGLNMARSFFSLAGALVGLWSLLA